MDIVSEKGNGTKFTFRLPLTLAIIRSILFVYKNESFALPLTSVTDIMRVSPEDIDTMAGRSIFRHRNRIVPLISIDGDPGYNGKSFIIFAGAGHLRAGIIAEKIIGEEELVIKALDENASTGIASGASILGNGSVVLILDPLSLIRKYSSRREDVTLNIEELYENSGR